MNKTIFVLLTMLSVSSFAENSSIIEINFKVQNEVSVSDRSSGLDARFTTAEGRSLSVICNQLKDGVEMVIISKRFNKELIKLAGSSQSMYACLSQVKIAATEVLEGANNIHVELDGQGELNLNSFSTK